MIEVLIIFLQFLPADFVPVGDTLVLYRGWEAAPTNRSVPSGSLHCFVVFSDSIRYQGRTILRVEGIRGLTGAIEGDTIKLFIKRDDCIIHVRKLITVPFWSRYFIIREKGEG